MNNSIADLVAVDNVLILEDQYRHFITVLLPLNHTLTKTIRVTILELDFASYTYDLTFSLNELEVEGITRYLWEIIFYVPALYLLCSSIILLPQQN